MGFPLSHITSISIFGGLVLSSCGTPYTYTATGQAQSFRPSTGTDSSGTPSTTSSPSPSPSLVPAASTHTSPLLSLRVGATGYTSTSVTVSTNKILKLKFTPGLQDRPAAGTGFYAQYSKLGVYLSVGGFDQPTSALNNGMQGAAVESSPVIDFSNSYSRTCSDNDPNCRQDVSVTIKMPNYDYFCLNFGTGCDWVHVYPTHPWHGTLSIQTDDTVSIQ